MSFYYDGDNFNRDQENLLEQDKKDLQELLQNKIFRKFIFGILEEGYIFSTTFTKSSQGYFNEGKREAALKWFNKVLDIDPHIFARMCLEFRSRDG
jgi:hypothetical protein